MLTEFSFVFPTLDRHFTWRLGSSCLHSAVRLLFNGWITDDSMDHDRRTIPKRNSWRRTFNFILNGKYSDVLCNSSLSVISFFLLRVNINIWISVKFLYPQGFIGIFRRSLCDTVLLCWHIDSCVFLCTAFLTWNARKEVERNWGSFQR